MAFPTPHLEKLGATLANEKLPAHDKPRIEAAIVRYQRWIADMEAVEGSPEEILERMVALLNEYRIYIDVDLVFDSEEDFLYRQKGQLKLDNSVIEEFLPRLINHNLIPELYEMQVVFGPNKCFSSAYFRSSLDSPQPGGGLSIRTKDQDFSIAKPLYLKASHNADFSDSITESTYLSYVSAECKTNLDKTMFQEACATAHDTKCAVVGSKYFLLCEWLDMTPTSTAPTDIDEIILLRKAKRINSNIRAHFSTAAKRRIRRADYLKYLQDYPFRADMFKRFLNHVTELVRNEQPEEQNVLQQGFF